MSADSVARILAPGERITTPERAEQLGLTADARRMRRERKDRILRICDELEELTTPEVVAPIREYAESIEDGQLGAVG